MRPSPSSPGRWPPTRASTTASWPPGLVWGLVSDATDVRVFFLVCVIVAGLYGAATVNKRILLVQALPAGARARRRAAQPLNHGRQASTPVTVAVRPDRAPGLAR